MRTRFFPKFGDRGVSFSPKESFAPVFFSKIGFKAEQPLMEKGRANVELSPIEERTLVFPFGSLVYPCAYARKYGN